MGAVDDLAAGQSTFMVEMAETAKILHHASDRSLVLLGEIRRGTPGRRSNTIVRRAQDILDNMPKNDIALITTTNSAC